MKARMNIFLIIILVFSLAATADDIYVPENINDSQEVFLAPQAENEPYGWGWTNATDQDNDGYAETIDCDDSDPNIHPNQDEICNNKDDNCDGNIDEGLERPYGSGMGQCSQGTQRCVEGDWVIIEPEAGPTEDICDGLDNDCDGSVDEDLSEPHPNQYGMCEGNTKVCSEGEWIDFDGNYMIQSERCDNLDNDCDGFIDEELNEATINQKGLCYGNTETCIAGVWDPDYGNYIPENETCDRSDNDCDGFVDEDFDMDFDGYYSEFMCTNSYYTELDCNDLDNDVNPGEREICGNGIDEDCDGEDMSCNYDGDGDGYTFIIDCDDANPYIHPGADETCDNKDNNCDGNIDENLNRYTSIQYGMCSGNSETCVHGSWISDPNNHNLSDEICDLYDNDCDGSVDEDLVRDSANQNGMCLGNIDVCTYGNWTGFIENHDPIDESIDGLDNDCDGNIDEGQDIDFDFDTNKNLYSLFDSGVLTLFAPDNSEVAITIIKPDGSKFRGNHSGNFPYLYNFDVFSRTGNYQIICDFEYLNYQEVVQKNIEVINSLTGEMTVPSRTTKEKSASMSGRASGGDAPYTYKWTFGDGTNEIGESVSHSYYTAGDYSVTLTITDASSKSISLIKKIKIENEWDTSFVFVDNQTGKPIENLQIDFDGHVKRTDEDGNVDFTTYPGLYDMKVKDNDYSFTQKKITVSSHKTYTYQIQKDDDDKPIVDISYPLPGQEIGTSDVTLMFRVIDQSTTTCSVFTKSDNGWWEYLGAIDNIQDSKTQNFEMSGLTLGDIEYNLVCADSSDNQAEKLGSFKVTGFASEDIVITSDDEEEPDYSVTEETLDRLSEHEIEAKTYTEDLQSLFEQVENAEDSIKAKLKETILYKNAVDANRELEKMARDLFSVREKTETEAIALIDKYIVLRDAFIHDTPKEIEIITGPFEFEYQNTAIPLDATNDFVKNNNLKLEAKDINKLYKQNKKLSSKFDATGLVFSAELLDEEKKEYTFITKSFDIEGSYSVVEYTGENLVSSSSAKKIADGKYIFELKEGVMSYLIPKKIESLETIPSTLVMNDVSEFTEESPNKITGFFTKMKDSGDMKFFVETVLIVLLISVYLVIQLDLVKKGKEFLAKNPDIFTKVTDLGSKISFNPELKEIKKSISKAKGHIKKNEISNAQVMYNDIMHKYAQLEGKLKDKIYPKTTHIFNEMVTEHIRDLLGKIHLHVDVHDHASAHSLYQEAQELYTQLPHKYKSKVSDESIKAYQRLCG